MRPNVFGLIIANIVVGPFTECAWNMSTLICGNGSALHCDNELGCSDICSFVIFFSFLPVSLLLMVLAMLPVVVLQKKKLYTNTAYVNALSLRIVPWRLAVRTIERANSILDFTFLEEEFQELTVVGTVGMESAL